MEHCMELRALKSSVRGELTMEKTQQHIVFYDFLVMNVINGGAIPNEDFSVDCFLDFNNGEFEEDFVEQKDAVPGLEWASHFVDDSLPELPFPCMVFRQQTENSENTRFEAEPGPVFVKTLCFLLSVPSKARSKRAKPAFLTWSVGSLPISESSASSICSGLVNDLAKPPTKRQKETSVTILQHL